MSDQPITLEFLARQQEQTLAELGAMRDDFRVLSAIAMRMDGTLTGLVTEIRATHAQYDRLASRIEKIEGKLPK